MYELQCNKGEIRMKICFFTTYIYKIGGEERIVPMIANELVDEHQVTIYTSDYSSDNEPGPYFINDKIEIRHFEYSDYRIISAFFRRLVCWTNKYFNFLQSDKFSDLLVTSVFPQKNRKVILECLKEEKFDFIIVTSANILLLGPIVPEVDATVFGWIHGTYESYFEQKRKGLWHLNNAFKNCLNNLDGCIVLNEDIQLKYLKNFGFDCEVIPNIKSFECKEKTELKNKTFVTTGRLVEIKQFELMIDAFALFSKKNKVWKLAIVGDGKLRKSLEKRIRKYNLADKITITGYIRDVVPFLKNATVYLNTSRDESFGLSVLEAMEVGLPVISFDINAMSELVMDGKNGFLVQRFDVLKYAEAMDRIIGDIKGLKKMSEFSINRASEFSKQIIMKRWSDILESNANDGGADKSINNHGMS